MTVSSSTNRTRLTSAGGTEFDFTFRIFVAADLDVYVITSAGVATLKTLTTDYTVALDSDGTGGTVTFGVAVTSGSEVLMVRNIDYTQPTDIPVNQGFREDTIETALDRLAMQIQQLKEGLDRSLTLSTTSEIDSLALPDPEANKFIAWNSAGTALVNTDGPSDVTGIEVTFGVGDAKKVLGINAAGTDFELEALSAKIQHSLEVVSNKIQLVNDTASPGNRKVYGTNGSGTRGWQDGTQILDADSDTGVEVEQSADEDKVRIKSAGTQRAVFDSNGLTLQSGVNANKILDEDNMASDDADALATQQSIKAYVDSLIGVSSARRQIFTADGSFTVPAGITQVFVSMVGGGGGGGGTGGNANDRASGGGAGETLIRARHPVTPGNSYSVVVGQGGDGALGVDGANGTNSSFDSTLVASFGTGGTKMDTGSAQTPGVGGGSSTFNAGAPTGGNGGFKGGNGGTGVAAGSAGGGGGTPFGRGPTAPTSAGGGTDATDGTGTGGTGGYAANQVGGDGANGIVIVEW